MEKGKAVFQAHYSEGRVISSEQILPAIDKVKRDYEDNQFDRASADRVRRYLLNDGVVEVYQAAAEKKDWSIRLSSLSQSGLAKIATELDLPVLDE